MLVPGTEEVDLDRELVEGVEVGGRGDGEPESKVIGFTVEIDEVVMVGGGKGGEPDAKVIGVVEKVVSLVSDGNEVVVNDDKVVVLGRREDGVLDCEVIGD